MSDLYKFRKYKKSQGKKKVKHPKLIVDEYKDEYGFMGLTSSYRKGKRHNNIRLSSNPKKGASGESYLRRKIEYDRKEMFEKILDDYSLSDEDKKYIIEYVNKHKKR